MSSFRIKSPLLTLVECAEIARTPLSSIRAWCASGKLRSVRPGRRRLVLAADLAEFLSIPLEDIAA